MPDLLEKRALAVKVHALGCLNCAVAVTVWPEVLREPMTVPVSLALDVRARMCKVGRPLLDALMLATEAPKAEKGGITR